MHLRRLVRKLKLALAGFAAGFAFACSGPTSPGEMPPLAPRPEPVQPLPGGNPKPVPGAPDPLDPSRKRTPDAGAPTTTPTTREHQAPQVRGWSSDRYQTPADAGVVLDDAGVMDDALTLPPVPDALPVDASKQPESELKS